MERRRRREDASSGGPRPSCRNPSAPKPALGPELDASTLSGLLLERSAPDSGTALLGLAAIAITTELLDAMVRALRRLDRPRERRLPTPPFVREMLYRLLADEQSPMPRHDRVARQSHEPIVRVLNWIRQHDAVHFA